MEPAIAREKEALEFARKAHGEQRRKYTDEPFIEHPKRVAELVRMVSHTPNMICAAYLHDVVQDTTVSLQTIQRVFGNTVGKLVGELTSEFVKEKYPRMNRRWRKEKETRRQKTMSADAKTIRLAEVIDNIPGIIKHDPAFAGKYIEEIEALMEALQGGDPKLFIRAGYEIERGKTQLTENKRT